MALGGGKMTDRILFDVPSVCRKKKVNLKNPSYLLLKMMMPQNKKIKSMTEIGAKYTIHKDI